MSEWWETTKKILSGKPRGSKLMVLGVFLVSLGVVLPAFGLEGGVVFIGIGSLAFGVGLGIYRDEAQYELEKKRKKDEKKIRIEHMQLWDKA